MSTEHLGLLHLLMVYIQGICVHTVHVHRCSISCIVFNTAGADSRGGGGGGGLWGLKIPPWPQVINN